MRGEGIYVNVIVGIAHELGAERVMRLLNVEQNIIDRACSHAVNRAKRIV
jgi:hypothetical protein